MSVENSRRVQFHYIKGQFFRVVHVDGVIGGPTPGGDIFVSVFSQRAAIPQLIVQEVDTETGELGREIPELREGKQGFVREVEVGLMMTTETAEQLVKWLQERIAIIQKATPTGKTNKSEVSK